MEKKQKEKELQHKKEVRAQKVAAKEAKQHETKAKQKTEKI